LEVIEKWKDHDLVKIIFAPHAPYTGSTLLLFWFTFLVDDAAFQLMKDVSKSLHQRIHIHLHETNQEVVDHVAAHKIRPIERMKNLGKSAHLSFVTNKDS
jgi:5-methylthioadenosine/S-adenosylhomocysteine deaminase